MALSEHLKPMPYAYGLLCMRLLGKLGGVNRLFIRELINYKPDVGPGEPSFGGQGGGSLALRCEWHVDDADAADGPDGSTRDMSFSLPFPLERAVQVLRQVAAAPGIAVAGTDGAGAGVRGEEARPPPVPDVVGLISADARDLDLNSFTVARLEETKRGQSRSSFDVVRAALSALVDVDVDGGGAAAFSVCTGVDESSDADAGEVESAIQEGDGYNADFSLVCRGLFAASVLDHLKGDALVLLKGLGTHIFFFLCVNRDRITRINCDGCEVDPFHQGTDGARQKLDYGPSNHIADGKIHSLNAIGNFRLGGRLGGGVDPFIFNETLARAFACEDADLSSRAATEVMNHVIDVYHETREKVRAQAAAGDETQSSFWGDVLFENLVSKMCEVLFNISWDHRPGLMSGLFELITKMGLEWSKQFEVEVRNSIRSPFKDGGPHSHIIHIASRFCTLHYSSSKTPRKGLRTRPRIRSSSSFACHGSSSVAPSHGWRRTSSFTIVSVR